MQTNEQQTEAVTPKAGAKAKAVRAKPAAAAKKADAPKAVDKAPVAKAEPKAKAAKTVKAAKPVEPVKPAKPAKEAKATKEAKTAKAAKPAKPTQAAKPVSSAEHAAKPDAGKKAATPGKDAQDKKQKVKIDKVEKVVRDSFTMPKSDYAKIAALKQKCLDEGVHVKKSELLRAGLLLLDAAPTKRLIAAIGELETVKTGRPAKTDA
ncbi:hypothetical protein [Pararobbsia silviterrae]|nr:hypothetical protein [Pararobbsia silviterrae]